ncbi:alcohol dehydrogenase [Lactonifactor longoviformis]|uniref:Alcohol dehydrogenase, class IV n=1 Tax=Lactonifactor longoviformis DSM 17459 TaxID=1122155 RepID=A0A1M4UVF5_9CLOT|nr:iron-containing alcohol dehydrogenase [Lactonifactor longoviformis]POP33782.1 alcohol dehydrogenase [Lactonifactor longoviformis]SHE60674.1 Alcohol dehydrogenase, class IV [Lactonifactor longoviformis DSM 17459]
MSYKLKIPSCIYGGEGCTSRLHEVIVREQSKRILVFTDKGVEGAGLTEMVLEQLRTESAEYRTLDELKPEPSYQEVESVCRSAEDFSCDLIIAVGGGSVMDTAKLCSLLKGAEYTIQDLMRCPAAGGKQIKTVMFPTTCGTGAEATCNAIVAIPEEQVKKGIVNEEMIPDYVFLDPLMIQKLPKSIIAATGVDALAHGIECFTSNKATPLSDFYAGESARLIFKNIRRAYSEPDNLDARLNLMLGAYYGGVAITGSGTTAVHALSYPLGGRFHIPHGVSNAVLFAHVMKMNKDACESELARLCRVVWPELTGLGSTEMADKVIREIEEVVAYTEIPVNLNSFGVKKKDLDFLVASGSQQKRLLDNNKKILTLEEIRDIYLKVLE